jgi:hypothetical protein
MCTGCGKGDKAVKRAEFNPSRHAYPEAVIRINEGPLTVEQDRLVDMLGDQREAGEKLKMPVIKIGGKFTGRAFALDHRYDWTLVKDDHGFVVLVPLYMEKAKFERKEEVNGE